MKYIVIGLGNYGSILAEELTILGHEVIGVDKNHSKVEQIKDKISTSFVLDSTDEQVLSILPLKAVDVVIVAIGKSFGESIKSVALLKKSGVKHIYARATDLMHKSVLEAFSLDKILLPEKVAARSLVKSLDLRADIESLQIDKEYFVVKFKTPKSLVGFKVGDLALEKEFGLQIITILKSEKTKNSIGISIIKRTVKEEESVSNEYIVSDEDYLVCYGKYKSFVSFWKTLT
ncbi:MAG: TrkA family potassium uptake protein [Rikenellaceae bacterium]